MANYDFAGWATKNDILCSDGRTIRRDAFADQDGTRVPLVWNHMHDSVDEVLGHADLENRPEGVYAYCSFNNTESGKRAKEVVKHNDICALSIYANHLIQRGGDVVHGMIREVSLVHAGANKGAIIDSVMAHGDMSDDEAVISFVGYGGLEVYHSDEEGEEMDTNSNTNSEETVKDVYDTLTDKQKKAVAILVGQILEEEKKKKGASDEETEDAEDESKESVKHSDSDSLKDELNTKSKPDDEKESEETVRDVYNTLTDKQKKVVDFLVGQAIAEAKNSNNEGEKSMKHNVFDGDTERDTYLSHGDQAEILENAKDPTVGTFKNAMKMYANEHDLDLSHADIAPSSGFPAGTVEKLFPDYKELNPGAPELITNDQGWVNRVINGVTKSPIARVRTTQVDIRDAENLMAKGYKKGNKKTLPGSPALLRRTTDPQTVYVKDALNRDDVVDITDFDYVQYMYNIDKLMLNETIARAILIGDGRLDDDPDKIWPTHIRPIWTDDDLYTMHVDIDLAGMKKSLQGTNTSANFGDEYVMAEAMVSTLLHATEDYRGTGTPDFFCTPNTLNTMLLARDMNGRRIYNTEAELATALGVKNIYRVKEFAGKTRTTSDNKKKELLGIYGNIADYVVGAVKGGQITKFDQFDIDFNQLKSLIETRFSGALAHVLCFVVVEKDVTTPSGAGA